MADAPTHPDFVAALRQRQRSGLAPACIGIDPRLGALPRGICPEGTPAERIVAFVREVLPAIAPHTPVVKPNVAFFERHGAAGFAAYEETCRLARRHDLLVIGDVKRGDIGSTAEAYAAIHLDLADAVTLHPLLGRDSVAPFLDRCRNEGKAVFILVRTSNPSAAELQGLKLAAASPGETVSAAIARTVASWGSDLGDPNDFGPVGAVVGATYPAELSELRALMPRALILLPGVGAQGGSVGDTRGAFDDQGFGALVNQSRGILQCFAPDDPDWLDAVRTAAARFAAELHREVGASRASE